MPAPDIGQTLEFLGTIFQACAEGTVWLTSLTLEPGGEVRSLASREGDAIEQFVLRYNEPIRSTYFCPSALRAECTGRSKDTVAFITGLHADIDFKNHEMLPAEIRRAIDQALLPASVIIESGGGLHLYWLFHEALEAALDTVERIEKLLHSLADHVGGDHEVAHCAALMRLPGTLNSKREAPVLTRMVESRPAARYELDELEEWLTEAARPLLTKRAKSNGAADPHAALAAYAATATQPAVDIEAVLDSMSYGDSENGVHASQTRAIAAMVARGFTAEQIDQTVLEATKRVHARNGMGRPWNWQKELRAITRSRETFEKKLAKQAKADAPKGERAAPANDPPPINIGAASPFSEDALAQEFADRHANDFRFVPAWGKWLCWSGVVWMPDEKLTAFARARTVCRETAKRAKHRLGLSLSTARTANAVTTLARADPRLVAADTQFDTEDWLLMNMENDDGA